MCRRGSSRRRSARPTSRASVAVRPWRSRCACHAKSPRRSRRTSRGSSPTTDALDVLARIGDVEVGDAGRPDPTARRAPPPPRSPAGASGRRRGAGDPRRAGRAERDHARSWPRRTARLRPAPLGAAGAALLAGAAGGGAGRAFQRWRSCRNGAFSGAGVARPPRSSDERRRRAIAGSTTARGGLSSLATRRYDATVFVESVPTDSRRPGRNRDVRPRPSGLDAFLELDERAAAFGCQLLEGSPGESARKNVAVLPAADGREGDAQRMREALLGQTRAVTPSADQLASICGGTAGDAGVGGGGVQLHSEVHLEASQSNGYASAKYAKNPYVRP